MTLVDIVTVNSCVPAGTAGTPWLVCAILVMALHIRLMLRKEAMCWLVLTLLQFWYRTRWLGSVRYTLIDALLSVSTLRRNLCDPPNQGWNWTEWLWPSILASKSFGVALCRAKIMRTHRHANMYSFNPQQAFAIALHRILARSHTVQVRWGRWGEGWRRRAEL